ncbi:DUF262 domain-containing protein [Methylobacterium oryzihabitans]|uniref:DUF262 domain-containing protein n=1 Tax=Methylobacterium oryzihabitans TaxID=2499852 RepID=UPI0016528AD6|nr:DUF262 domain-containing protein [Methylobacterium oryzihabitans]
MSTPLNASASSAGALISNATFEVPQFQREYSWGDEEVADFWNDLRNNLNSDSYFLGLIILTEEDKRKHVVDGQQRLITLSLLATAIYHEAVARGRKALADRIQADFLRAIDYDSDQMDPRVTLTDKADNDTFQAILEHGLASDASLPDDSVSSRIVRSFNFLRDKIREDLKADPFKRLGRWTEFLTNKLYFAVFVHPTPSSAYQVFEVINTRGKELTTADLLKNYILSQTQPAKRQDRYSKWQKISKNFSPEGSNTFVQYIRHTINVECGYILPKDLFAFLAERTDRVESTDRRPPKPDEIMSILEGRLSLYLQMADPTRAGPADADTLGYFSAFNKLGVTAIRPLMLAILETPESQAGLEHFLKIVVQRIVVGSLGASSIERRFSEAARRVHLDRNWSLAAQDFRDLVPTRDDFISQFRRKSFNKNTISFIRSSVIQKTTTPMISGTLHYIWPRQAGEWKAMNDEEGLYWASTIGNTILLNLDRRPKQANSWSGFKNLMLPNAVSGEWSTRIGHVVEWDASSVEQIGAEMAEVAGDIWC